MNAPPGAMRCHLETTTIIAGAVMCATLIAFPIVLRALGRRARARHRVRATSRVGILADDGSLGSDVERVPILARRAGGGGGSGGIGSSAGIGGSGYSSARSSPVPRATGPSYQGT